MKHTNEQIARVCHETNRSYCAILGDHSQVEWESAPKWQQDSAINGVQFIIDKPGALPHESHESWLEEKRVTGWKYGPVKDSEKKEHPCFVSYSDLPVEQRRKDYLFGAVVRSMLAE